METEIKFINFDQNYKFWNYQSQVVNFLGGKSEIYILKVRFLNYWN